MKQQNHMLRIFTIICAVLCLSLNTQAQSNKRFNQVLDGSKNELVTGATSTLSDADFFDVAYASRIVKPYPVKNIVSLRLNETSPLYISSDFTDTVKVRIISKDYNLAVDSLDKIFIINYKNAQPYTPVFSEIFTGKYEVTLKVLSITSDVTWNTVPLLMLENVMETQPDFTFSCTEDVVSQMSFTQPLAGADELPVYWQHLPGVDAYDLEWTFVDSSAVATVNPVTLFRNNASRVTISANSYKIPLLYDGKGALFFRVRAVQEKGKGFRKEGTWSVVNTSGQGRFDFDGHERALNWQATTSFAEEGKRKSVVQYYDGSLRSRQTVTKDNTRDTTIIAESFYDYQGRPVIQVLPAPSLSNVIQYTKDFNRGINGAEYDKNNYDLLTNPAASCNIQAAPLSTASGTSQYYSANNPDKSGLNKYIPDASGYPFTETEYTPDNTGRIKRQGGVGPDHKLSSGHETKYYYGGYPDQNELDMLFGTEAGDRTHYQKNMVRDANGQYSVSYVDMHGRTIATALAGNVPDSLRMSSLAPSAINVTETIADKTSNNISGLVMQAQKELLVPTAGYYNFNYSLDPQTLLKDDCNKKSICYSCLYDLRITITDDCGNQKLGGKAFDTTLHNFSLEQLSNSCNNAPMNLSFGLQLEEGSYLVTKKLSINNESLAHYRDTLFAKNNTCKTLDQFIEEQRALLRQTLCPPQDCNTCMANIGTWDNFRNKYMQSAGIAVADSSDNRAEAWTAYQNALDACSTLCNNATEYDEIRKAMLLDMSAPSGQYADVSIGAGDKYSIFFIASTASKTTPPPYTDSKITYLDENGKPDKVFDERTGTYVLPQDLAPDQFAARFKSSWAEALLPLHPEHCKLLELEKHKASLAWDRDFANTETYAEALSKGYLNPLGLIDPLYNKFNIVTANIDPLSKESNALKKEIQDSITKYRKYNNGDLITLWAVASITGACNNTDKTAQNTCVEKYRKTENAFDNAMCDADKDMAWQQFRQYYLGIKSSITDRLVAKANCKDKNSFSQLLKYTPPHTLNFNNATDAMIQNTGQMGNTQPTEAEAKTRAGDYYQNSCEQYATQWMQQLKNCVAYDPAALNVIIPQLVTVCRKGSDADHPYGSRDISPDSSNTFKSFDEVIANYNQIHNITTSLDCNADVITTPKSFNAQHAVGNKPVFTTPSSCECDKIKSLYNQYATSHKIGENLTQWMLRTQQTTINATDFNTLLASCNAKTMNGTTTCYYLPKAITLPPALQCYTAPPCVTCDQVNNLYTQYERAYPQLLPTNNFAGDSLQEVKNNLFASFMNNKLGFNKGAWDYLTFRDSCKKYSSGSANGNCEEERPVTIKIAKNPLTVPSSGVPVPAELNCYMMLNLYRSFINDFPDFRKGASFKMYLPDEQPAIPQILRGSYNSSHINEQATSDTFKITIANGIVSRQYFVQDSTGIKRLVTDYVYTAEKNELIKEQSASLKSQQLLGASSPPSSVRSVDTTLSPTALFEWYFNSRLGFSSRGYTWQNYADWLINYAVKNCSSNFYFANVPWSDSIYIKTNDLNNTWSSFKAQYSTNLSLVSRTINRPLLGKIIVDGYLSDGQFLKPLPDYYSLQGISDVLLCDKLYSVSYDITIPVMKRWTSFSIPLKDIPASAAIDKANVKLNPEMRLVIPCKDLAPNTGQFSHQRDIDDAPTAVCYQQDGFFYREQSTGKAFNVSKLGNEEFIIPTITEGVTDFLTYCMGYNFNRFTSDQKFLLDVTGFINGVHDRFKKSGIIYPVLMNPTPGTLDKMFNYAFANDSVEITFSSSRCDMLTSIINEKYNLHLSTDEAKQLFVLTTGLQINDDCAITSVYEPKPPCPPAGNNCNSHPTKLIIPISNKAKPVNIDCNSLKETYNNFIADFPYHTKGATFKMFVQQQGGLMQLMNAQSQNVNVPAETLPPADTINLSAMPQRRLLMAAPVTGRWVDTTLSAKQLFEWYFDMHLQLQGQGYNYADYASWLVNSCNVQLKQSPWADTVYIEKDSLQSYWQQFLQTYPAGITSINVNQELKIYKPLIATYSTSLGYNYVLPSNTLRAHTWTVGSWYVSRSTASIPIAGLPDNATINSANLYLYAANPIPGWSSDATAHFRYVNDMPYTQIRKVGAMYIPNNTRWENQPPVDDTAPIKDLSPTTLRAYSSGSSNDFYSNEDYIRQDITDLFKNMYTGIKQHKANYPLLFRLNNENESYKRYTFWSGGDGVPAGKEASVVVNFSASRCDIFSAFINNKLGAQLDLSEIKILYETNALMQLNDDCATYTDLKSPCEEDNIKSLLLCGNATPVFNDIAIERHDNCSDSTFFAISKATALYNSYRDSLNNSFENDYTQKCLQAINYESFTVSHPVTEFHYTLYYYGQDGNLLKTIPPAGVSLNTYTLNTWLAQVRAARAAGTTLVPAHGMPTQYRYNSLNQVAAQNSPDGGQNRFWYDRLGRLAISQNAEQAKTSKYSYTQYDDLGRITEVGQTTNVTSMTDAISRKADALQQWMDNAASFKEQITVTVYDKPYTPLQPEMTAVNLRTRVAYTQVFDTKADMDNNNAASATYYSYDIHGNVDTLLQDYKQSVMAVRGNRFKKVIYNYDLISGKVNQVSYQPGQPDAFYHKYLYDAENRITDVLTSSDSVHWEKEAWYSYYKHGPLARTVLGQNQVQGIDYAYTLQGWLKSINPDTLSDGNAVAKKAYTYGLNYYSNDYNPIGSTIKLLEPRSIFYSLFNGNISSTYQKLPIDDAGNLVQRMQDGRSVIKNYKYDQLNRITSSEYWKQDGGRFYSNTDLNELFYYDANGNITSLYRNGDRGTGRTLEMDYLSYTYIPGTNKLDFIQDGVPDANYNNDIDNQQPGNYQYDAIGNLTKDVQAGIGKIEWTVYGKIKKISKADGSTINYTYDASGNRITKTTNKGTTIYVRDAQGNVLSVYEQKDSADLTQSEVHLYGSSRLGIWEAGRNVEHPEIHTYASYLRDKKFFELANHLGNVLVTVMDSRRGVDKNGDGIVDYYEPVIYTAQDYYAFGMLTPAKNNYGQSGMSAGDGSDEPNNALDLNGTSITGDWGNVFDLVNNFTIEMWVKPAATQPVLAQSNYGYAGQTRPERYVIYPLNPVWVGKPVNDAGVGISVGTNGVSVVEQSNSYVPAVLSWQGSITDWTHVAVVYKDKQPSLYINGELVKTGEVSAKSNVHPSYNIAAGDLGTYIGQVEEIRVWSTCRTAQEIKDNKDYFVNTTAPDLEGYWKFSQTDSPQITDVTGKGHNIKFAANMGSIVASTAPVNANNSAALFAGTYRYGFNGKENDNDVKGVGNQINFGGRIYDPRIGRFSSLDPMAGRYPGESNYSFAGNSPIQFIDYNGNFKISTFFVQKYPTLTRMLQYYLPLLKDNPQAKAGWIRAIGFNNEAEGGKAFDDMVTYGNGPWITPTRPYNSNIPGLSGFFEPTGNKGEWQGSSGYVDNITVQYAFLDQLEALVKKADANDIGQHMFAVSVLIMHEATHWGKKTYKCCEVEGDDKKEMGANFEFNTFGTRFSYQNADNKAFDVGKLKKFYNQSDQKGAYGTSSFGFSINQSSNYWSRAKNFPLAPGQKGDPSLKDNGDTEPEGKVYTQSNTDNTPRSSNRSY